MKNLCYKLRYLLAAFFFLLLSSKVYANDTDVIVKARGTKANGVFAHFKLLVNNYECGDHHASMTCKEYSFSVPFTKAEIEEVKIVFDNDLYSLGEDRNLCVHSIIIGDDVPIKVCHETVKYVYQNGENHIYCGMMGWNGTLIINVKNLRFQPENVTLSSQADVDAFTSQYLDGSITISGKDITDLTPLSSIARIKGSLIIRDNPNLVNISGLNSVLSIGFISIENNPRLEAIDGLHSIEKCGGMHIRNNKSLKAIKCLNSPDI